MKLNKKLSAAVIISMLSLSLVGCGGKESSVAPSNNNPIKGSNISSELEEKILNEGELTDEDVQKAIQAGVIERIH